MRTGEHVPGANAHRLFACVVRDQLQKIEQQLVTVDTWLSTTKAERRRQSEVEFIVQQCKSMQQVRDNPWILHRFEHSRNLVKRKYQQSTQCSIQESEPSSKTEQARYTTFKRLSFHPLNGITNRQDEEMDTHCCPNSCCVLM